MTSYNILYFGKNAWCAKRFAMV